VCSFWLEKGDDIHLVEDYVREILIVHAENKICFHSINFWMSKNGDFETIKPVIIEYLKHHWKTGYGIRIIKNCIRANKIFKEIEIAVFKVVNSFKVNLFINYLEIVENRIVLKSYLDEESKMAAREIGANLSNKKNAEQMKEEVKNYLNKYGLDVNASFFLPSWIRYNYDYDFGKDMVIEWLDKYILIGHESAYVISAAIVNSKWFDLLHKKSLEWLHHFGETEDAKFVLVMWLNDNPKRDVKEVEKWIEYWVAHYYDPDDAHWVSEKIINHVRNVSSLNKAD
jgi:hypothetical protein